MTSPALSVIFDITFGIIWKKDPSFFLFLVKVVLHVKSAYIQSFLREA